MVVETFNYRDCAIRRFVVGNDHFEIRKYLADNTFERSCNKFLAVECRNANADERL
jgi:hypothetical protein